MFLLWPRGRIWGLPPPMPPVKDNQINPNPKPLRKNGWPGATEGSSVNQPIFIIISKKNGNFWVKIGEEDEKPKNKKKMAI